MSTRPRRAARISVVVTTYERPAALELVLRGYAAQDDVDFEIVVADDGSGTATAALIERLRADTPLRITHVRQPDRGFRKCEILNRAFPLAGGDYLIFTDGDCIPRRDLIAVHRRLARPGRFVAGGYLKLPAVVSDRITVDDVETGRIADLAWLRAHGWRPGRRALRLTRSPTLGRLFDLLTPTRTNFLGNNTGVWQEDLIAVNGFEGEMGYGGLDREIGYRLRNAGVRGVQARHRAVALHLDHGRPWRRPDVERRNREIIAEVRRTGRVRAHLGIAELDPAEEVSVSR